MKCTKIAEFHQISSRFMAEFDLSAAPKGSTGTRAIALAVKVGSDDAYAVNIDENAIAELCLIVDGRRTDEMGFDETGARPLKAGTARGGSAIFTGPALRKIDRRRPLLGQWKLMKRHAAARAGLEFVAGRQGRQTGSDAQQ